MYKDREEAVADLAEKMIDGNINDSIIAEARKRKETITQERLKQKQIATEEQASKRIVANRPENHYSQLYNFKHVYPGELDAYEQNYNLPELEIYLEAMRGGAYYDQFKNGTAINAMAHLTSVIQRRKREPAQAKPQSIQETRDEIKVAKKEFDKVAKQIEDTKKDLKTLGTPLHPNPDKKQKAYTT